MKRFVKLVLVAIPALVIAATVGLTTMGCGDDTTTSTPDLATRDMAMPRDMAVGG